MKSAPIKGYKVSNITRSKIFGIAGRSLNEVLTKACTKFGVSKEEVNLCLQDGTVVDAEEYFETLPSQTMLILGKKSEDVLTGAEIIYNALSTVHGDVLKAGEQVRKFFDENLKEKVRVLARLITRPGDTEDKTLKSTIKEHPEWFQGLETNCTRKEAFMGRRAQDRVRGYFYKSKEDLRKSQLYKNEKEGRIVLDQALDEMKQMLGKETFMAGYFNREDKKRLCNQIGGFHCSGPWSQIKCEHRGGKGHWINPYTSREQRIIFSTWNLDHRIERSRSILPSLLESVGKVIAEPHTLRINSEYFFRLLFTSENLRLVHVVCHDKTSHSSARVDPSRAVIQLKPTLVPEEIECQPVRA